METLGPENVNELLTKGGIDCYMRGLRCAVHDSRCGLERERCALQKAAATETRGHQKRSARPAVSSGCGEYSPGFSPHRRGEGKTFVGFESCKGSKAQRTRCMVARSGSANIFAIMHFFSSPTPCSPVIEPPAARQSSRIFVESARAASS